MLCDNCKKNVATFFSTININGVVTEKHLCENCAEFSGELNLKSFFNPTIGINLEKDNSDELMCNNCGYTLHEYLNSSFLGCSNCYNVFENYIKKSLPQIQSGLMHVGKVPEGKVAKTPETLISKLEKELKTAVSVEDYEKASEIKRELEKLKDSKNGNK